MFSANTSQVSNDVKYIEDFFSAWLRTGTGSSQTVTTGIKENTGALVISKSRSAATDWAWYDTFRGATKDLASNTTAAETTQSQGLTSFNTDGHTWGTLAKVNTNGATYVDFVLKPTPKFFDVVTYTGNGSGDRTISHNLGSAPGFIVVKATSTTSDWYAYHRSLGNTNVIYLNQTSATATYVNLNWNVTSTTFVADDFLSLNDNGVTYVAYLFAHDAGGFGLTGTDNVISCGSFTTDGSGNATVNLGYEPQYLLIKRTDSTSSWLMFDTMRELSLTGRNYLYANTSGAEVAESGNYLPVTATGFQWLAWAGASVQTWAYIAIRRGPMKTPTSGTSVFAANKTPSTNIGNVGFPVDLGIMKAPSASQSWLWGDRLRGWNTAATTGYILYSDTTGAENSQFSGSGPSQFDVQNGFGTGLAYTSYNFWNFRRAPGFFDEVCSNGDSSGNLSFTHNLGVAPELVILKSRTGTFSWYVYCSALAQPTKTYGMLDSTFALTPTASTYFAATSTTFQTFTGGWVANNGASVAYLFATCAGVSKVGSYTGTGATQTIDCGFTGGARFVLIKRTDSTGNWWTWNTASGMVAGTDPRMAFNSPAAEANNNWVYTDASGFQIVTTDATVNASGGSYIYLAIA